MADVPTPQRPIDLIAGGFGDIQAPANDRVHPLVDKYIRKIMSGEMTAEQAHMAMQQDVHMQRAQSGAPAAAPGSQQPQTGQPVQGMQGLTAQPMQPQMPPTMMGAGQAPGAYGPAMKPMTMGAMAVQPQQAPQQAGIGGLAQPPMQAAPPAPRPPAPMPGPQNAAPSLGGMAQRQVAGSLTNALPQPGPMQGGAPAPITYTPPQQAAPSSPAQAQLAANASQQGGSRQYMPGLSAEEMSGPGMEKPLGYKDLTALAPYMQSGMKAETGFATQQGKREMNDDNNALKRETRDANNALKASIANSRNGLKYQQIYDAHEQWSQKLTADEKKEADDVALKLMRLQESLETAQLRLQAAREGREDQSQLKVWLKRADAVIREKTNFRNALTSEASVVFEDPAVQKYLSTLDSEIAQMESDNAALGADLLDKKAGPNTPAPGKVTQQPPLPVGKVKKTSSGPVPKKDANPSGTPAIPNKRTEVKRQFSPSTKMTKITYSDGTTEIVKE